MEKKYFTVFVQDKPYQGRLEVLELSEIIKLLENGVQLGLVKAVEQE